MIPSPLRAQQILEQVLGLCRRRSPSAEASVQLRAGRNANTRFAQNGITSTGDADDATLRVEVALGRRHAFATTNQLDAPALERVCESALAMAKLAPEDPEHQPVLPPQRYAASPADHDPATLRLGAEVRAEAARAAIAHGQEAKLEIAGYFEHTASAWALANSAGLRAYHASTSAELTTTARTPDGHGSGWAGAWSHRARDLDAGALARTAADKALRSQKPRRLEPGRYTVILEPAAVGELLGFFADALEARNADEGRSFFARPGGGTRLGEQIFGEGITLRADPTSAETPGAPFDADGLPLAPTTFVDRGKLAALVYSRFWAHKQSKRPTGRPNRFLLEGGRARTEDLLKGVARGVLITRFWYTRSVDPQALLITGLTRDGVFLVENGQISAPVNNFRFNESPVVMLKNADALTQTTVRIPYGAGRYRVPALRTHEFHLASISEAV